MENLNYWEFIAGLGIFLLGMHQMESGLKELAGKSFRTLLQKFTNKSWKGILTGTFITSILQSSSLVTLMVLAFLGAGLISLQNSIGVILGANLGTTVTAWIVATLGFKISISSFSLPFIGIGALFYQFFSKRIYLKNFGLLLLGFGFLFFGIDLMKTSIELLAQKMELSQFAEVRLIFFLGLGIVLTALIQSSSATLVILLSALNSDVITLDQAAAATVGANIGTTITVILGAIGGTPDKKRLASVHFIFNFCTGILIFPFIPYFITILENSRIGGDHLILLVVFNTLMNLAGIIIFFPFLGFLRSWINQRFKTKKISLTSFIHNVDTSVPEAAIKAVEKELDSVFDRTKFFIKETLGIEAKAGEHESIWQKVLGRSFELIHVYNEIKEIEDEITEYHIKIQSEPISEVEARHLSSLMESLRSMVYSAKAMKGITQNIKELESAERNLPKKFLLRIQDHAKVLFEQIEQLRLEEKEKRDVPQWLQQLQYQDQIFMEDLYKEAKSHQTDIPFSTLSNVGNEYCRSLYSLGVAVLHWQHPKTESSNLDQPKQATA
ncbi:MAG TPA: sodium:phosphate symporter [Algoriphagus sp.]|jgi:phosphate:Na+ symporter|uniref:Na/Pi cotransporter family protein n=1 Tax=unclassified Algoriphagus TaxID=2641541 RepID=UPI000C658EEE|nr:MULTISPECIES: Na/Pi symporter [unclassified Algoriphagus]MAL15358.1 sodium:phosphate symporter [Algoriphagus sp.]HAH36531.1 sodium:phosphate symporter [Algoriphagus sp.]HAS58753.1 sodium:phosphate symporter [Algoriphagus sp.]HCB45758.1 sodium:phosphate symporter [Algoriphagus sp.]HCD87262.1 sodium:phosphate symporter [Algoriphagus sp.]|tara:strand:+ start:11312 stop:12973 length:1662 start_codon:yes stop_codon:yes gene_type:complete